jgi:hypothetical protein
VPLTAALVTSCGGIGGGRTGLAVVDLRAESGVQHGVRVWVVNLHDDQFGNAKLPQRFETLQKRRKPADLPGAKAFRFKA